VGGFEVRQHHPVIHPQVINQLVIGAGEDPGIGGVGGPGEDEFLPEFAVGRSSGNLFEADFGAGEIGEDADGAIELPGDMADGGDDPGEPLVLAVGEIEPEDVDPSLDQLLQPGGILNGGAHRGDDLGFDEGGLFARGGHDSVGRERKCDWIIVQTAVVGQSGRGGRFRGGAERKTGQFSASKENAFIQGGWFLFGLRGPG